MDEYYIQEPPAHYWEDVEDRKMFDPIVANFIKESRLLVEVGQDKVEVPLLDVFKQYIKREVLEYARQNPELHVDALEKSLMGAIDTIYITLRSMLKDMGREMVQNFKERIEENLKESVKKAVDESFNTQENMINKMRPSL